MGQKISFGIAFLLSAAAVPSAAQAANTVSPFFDPYFDTSLNHPLIERDFDPYFDTSLNHPLIDRNYEYVDELEVMDMRNVRNLEELLQRDILREFQTERNLDEITRRNELYNLQAQRNLEKLTSIDYIPADPSSVLSELQSRGYYVPDRIDRDFLDSIGLEGLKLPEEIQERRIANELYGIERRNRLDQQRLNNELYGQERYRHIQQKRILNELLVR